MELKELDKLKHRRFINVRRRAVNLPEGELIKTTLLNPDRTLPLVIEPAINDVDLIGWAKENREFFESRLAQYGALLFRNFNVPSSSEFRRFAEAICSKLATFTANIHPTPKDHTASRRTGATYPVDKKIRWHNEDSFDNFHWPSKIIFYCAKSAEQGGGTPITDCRQLLRLIAPATREKFVQKGVMYVKNYYPELGMKWQNDFATTSESEMERHCREASIEFSWNENRQLRIQYVRPAVVRHPRSGEMIWFNQAQLLHTFFLEPEVLALWKLSFAEENFPANCYYGDGSRIEDPEMRDVFRAYNQIETTFSWQQGDILVLDNMLVAHARSPFVGAREIYVAMDPVMSYQDIEAPAIVTV